jgi:hypothetical protein
MKSILLSLMLLASGSAFASGAQVFVANQTPTPNTLAAISYSGGTDIIFDTANYSQAGNGFYIAAFGTYTITVHAEDSTATAADTLTFYTNNGTGDRILCHVVFTGSGIEGCSGADITQARAGDIITVSVISSSGNVDNMRLSIASAGR